MNEIIKHLILKPLACLRNYVCNIQLYDITVIANFALEIKLLEMS